MCFLEDILSEYEKGVNHLAAVLDVDWEQVDVAAGLTWYDILFINNYSMAYY